MIRQVYFCPPEGEGVTTNQRSGAEFRFKQAVRCQGFVDEALPDELKDASLPNIRRMTKVPLTGSLGLANSIAK
ncbi:MAG: hypothetical protein AABM67_11720 [Acidobacteriota bacterium]